MLDLDKIQTVAGIELCESVPGLIVSIPYVGPDHDGRQHPEDHSESIAKALT